MKYYKNGKSVIATKGVLPFEEITKEEFESEMGKINTQIEENFVEIPTEADRLEAVEMAILELAEVLTNG